MNPTIHDDDELLALMLRDQESQSGLYRPGPYWRGYQERSAKAIRRLGLANFRSQPAIGKGFADTIATNPFQLETNPDRFKARFLRFVSGLSKVKKIVRLYQELLDARTGSYLHYRNLYYNLQYKDYFLKRVAELPFPDTLVGNTMDCVEFDGKQYATIYLRNLLAMDTFAPLADYGAMRSVMEIGGGFGCLMHTLLSCHSNIEKLVYLDIPPMIYIATQYFKAFFGEAVTDYRQTRTMDRIRFADRPGREIICICPWQIEKLDLNIDMLWNFASFSEMTPDIVQNYANHTKRLSSPNTVLCFNMNKLATDTTSSSQQIMDAFGDMFDFEPVEALVIDKTRHYFLGRHKDASK